MYNWYLFALMLNRLLQSLVLILKSFEYHTMKSLPTSYIDTFGKEPSCFSPFRLICRNEVLIVKINLLPGDGGRARKFV